MKTNADAERRDARIEKLRLLKRRGLMALIYLFQNSCHFGTRQ